MFFSLNGDKTMQGEIPQSFQYDTFAFVHLGLFAVKNGHQVFPWHLCEIRHYGIPLIGASKPFSYI